MSKIQHTELGHLVEFQRGFDLPKSQFVIGKYPVRSSNGILGYHNEFKALAPGITIGRSGTVGIPHLVNENFFPHNTALFIKDFKGNDVKYIYYLIKNLKLNDRKTGSGVPTMNRNHLHPLKILAHLDSNTQSQIAKVLSDLDAKIELNNKINAELEGMAKLIYDYWFVQFEFPSEALAKDGLPSPPAEGCPKDGVVPETTPPQKRNSKNYFSLPYNPKLKERAKALRKAGNLAEVLFWKQVKNKQFKGLDFDRQKIIGNYIVDFYCPNYQLVVEIDGSSHDNKEEYDAQRDAYLESLGLTVLHFRDTEVKQNISHVLRCLEEHPVFQEENEKDHPAFQAPLHGRGSVPYKSSGGKMIYNEELKREIPEGWEVKELCEVLTVTRGASPRPIENYLSNEGLPWVKISDATKSNNRFILDTKQFIKASGKSKTRVLKPGSLILSNSASPAIPRIVKIQAGIHDGWLLINNLKHSLSEEFMFHYFTYERPRIINLGSGSIFKNLKTDYVKSLKIVLPPENILNEAQKQFCNISEKVYVNTKQNQELAQLRDWLLPMLMNGQVRVSSSASTLDSAEPAEVLSTTKK